MTKPREVFLLFLLAALAWSTAARADSAEQNLFDYQERGSPPAFNPGEAPPPPPRLDPKRIVNESNSFLKEREPEMTAEEYALYEKMVDLLAANPTFALTLLEQMMSDKEAPSPAFQFILGNAYYAAGQYDKAEANYRGAVDRYPTFLRAWDNLGVLYYTTDRFGDAIPCLSKAITLGDHDAGTFGLLGYCLEQQGSLDSAEVAYMQALQVDPSNPDWMEGLLRIYIDGKQWGRAEPLAKRLINLHPQEPHLWMTYASILLAQNRKLEAMALLEAASGTGTAGVSELNLLGDLYASEGLVPEAIATYRRVLAASPEVAADKMLRLAEALIGQQRWREADDALDAVEPRLAPSERVDFLQARTDLLEGQQRWSEARRELDRLLKLAPLDGRALLSLGDAYAAEGDPDRASFAFEEAYRIPASRYRASLELANLELKDRHYEKCADYLQKALNIERTDEVEDYLARVRTLIPNNGPSQP